MRDYKWQIFTVALCLGVVLTISLSPSSKNSIKKKQPPKKELVNVISEINVQNVQEEVKNENQILDLDEKAFQIGYQKGQRAMLIQMGKPELINKTAEYTVNFEIPENEKERLEAIMSKAYVEGYHKASDLVYCPRCEK